MAEGQALGVITHDPSSSQPPECSIDIEEDKPKMPKVLPALRKALEQKCYYDPQVVSIGPHHHYKTDLKVTKEQKKRMAEEFVNITGTTKKSCADLRSEVKKVASKAKESYDWSLMDSLDDEAFIEMMFLDGCFILQFIHCITSDNPKDYESLKMSDGMVVSVRQDLLLLENQLPYVVLEALITSDGKRKEWWSNKLDRFIKFGEPKPFSRFWLSVFLLAFLLLFLCFWPLLLLCYFSMVSLLYLYRKLPEVNKPGKPERTKEEGTVNAETIEKGFDPSKGTSSKDKKTAKGDTSATKEGENNEGSNTSHLLGCLYTHIIYNQIICQQGKNEPLSDKEMTGEQLYAKAIYGQHLYFSAKYLRKVGVHFSSKIRGLQNVAVTTFYNLFSTVHLHSITISELDKSTLLNLVAYEASLGENVKHWVTSYICFIDSLIDDADDVNELRSKGVIVNYYGTDQKVADLFNCMGKSLRNIDQLKPNAYNDITTKINQLCESRPAQWIDEIHQKHCRNPFLAAALGFAIILTFIQTYIAVFPLDK